jgi:hypothetical protein
MKIFTAIEPFILPFCDWLCCSLNYNRLADFQITSGMVYGMIRPAPIYRYRSFLMEDKITIIEGPPPTFESVGVGWALGLNESPLLFNVNVTKLRTFNGLALLERCHRAWRHSSTIHLEYRDEDGLENRAPILAARALDTDEGQVLLLWVRMEINPDEIDLPDDDLGDDFDDIDSNDDLDSPNI